MTLASGGIGDAVISNNITTSYLMNVKRLAYEINPPTAYTFAPDIRGAGSTSASAVEVSKAEIEEIVRRPLS